MTVRSKRISAALIGSVSALLLLTGSPALTQSRPIQSASGHGALATVDERGANRKRQFSFTAQRNADGTVKGSATLINPAFSGNPASPAPFQLQLDIECMVVFGNVAIFGGSTRRTNDRNLNDAAFFAVQDNGEPGRNDRISRVFFFDDDPTTTGDPQLCRNNVPEDFGLLEQIINGNIQVRP